MVSEANEFSEPVKLYADQKLKTKDTCNIFLCIAIIYMACNTRY
jgi:hypothetical protein